MPEDLTERRLAGFAHLTIHLGLISAVIVYPFPPLGLFLAMLIWRTKRSSNEWVAIQALQATILQAIVMPFWFIPGGYIILILACSYTLVAGIMAYFGRDPQYPLIGKLAKKIQMRMH